MDDKDTCALQGISHIGERGQIVIPQSIRKALHIQAGDAMALFVRNGKILVIPASQFESMAEQMLQGMNQLRRSLDERPKPKKQS